MVASWLPKSQFPESWDQFFFLNFFAQTPYPIPSPYHPHTKTYSPYHPIPPHTTPYHPHTRSIPRPFLPLESLFVRCFAMDFLMLGSSQKAQFASVPFCFSWHNATNEHWQGQPKLFDGIGTLVFWVEGSHPKWQPWYYEQNLYLWVCLYKTFI